MQLIQLELLNISNDETQKIYILELNSREEMSGHVCVCWKYLLHLTSREEMSGRVCVLEVSVSPDFT